MPRQPRYLRAAAPKPVKLTKKDKEKIESVVSVEIEKTEKLKNDVAVFKIKACRLYFYFHKELEEGQLFYTGTLIDDKHTEHIYGRITIWDNEFKNCSLDWQRHNNQWIEMDEGTLVECIEKMEEHSWFHTF
jgi:hypothetical protein